MTCCGFGQSLAHLRLHQQNTFADGLLAPQPWQEFLQPLSHCLHRHRGEQKPQNARSDIEPREAEPSRNCVCTRKDRPGYEAYDSDAADDCELVREAAAFCSNDRSADRAGSSELGDCKRHDAAYISRLEFMRFRLRLAYPARLRV